MNKQILDWSREQFVEKYPDPVMVWLDSNSADIEAGFATTALAPGQLEALLDTSARQWMIFAVTKSDRNNFKNMVTLGRTNNNDIVISDASVSKFHAYLSIRAGSGVYTVTDSGSSNGTSINDAKVEPHKHHPIESGETLVVGGVHLRFYLSGDFFDFVEKLRQEGEI